MVDGDNDDDDNVSLGCAGRLTVPTNGEQLRRKSYDLAADGGKSNRLGLLLNRLNLPAAM